MPPLGESSYCVNCGAVYRTGQSCPNGCRSRRLRRLAALPVICAILAALAACGPSGPPAPPTVFTPVVCPVGQNVKMTPAPLPPGCVR
jgi:hypothetical protein